MATVFSRLMALASLAVSQDVFDEFCSGRGCRTMDWDPSVGGPVTRGLHSMPYVEMQGGERRGKGNEGRGGGREMGDEGQEEGKRAQGGEGVRPRLTAGGGGRDGPGHDQDR